ncbi:radical SAM protein, partial [bacterium]|nr:radical SAM protein [bacterium]
IVSQILLCEQDTGLKITNVVFMGQGEPLDNFENVTEAFKIINQNLQISTRRMTVSTAGVVPKIKALTELSAIPTLAISLHSPNHEKRLQIMPIEKKYSMSELKSALKEFNQTTKDRITIEYILIKDFNDSIKDAKELIEYLSDLKCNINIIPYNSIEENIFQKPDKKTIMKFKYLLEQSGKKVTVRLERGADIDAACGQLAGRYNS